MLIRPTFAARFRRHIAAGYRSHLAHSVAGNLAAGPGRLPGAAQQRRMVAFFATLPGP